LAVHCCVLKSYDLSLKIDSKAVFLESMAYKFVDNYRERGARKKLVEHLKSRGIADERVLAELEKYPGISFLMKHSGIRPIKISLFQLATDKLSLSLIP